MFYLIKYSRHFICDYMVSDVWYGSLRQWWPRMYGMGHFDSDGVGCMVWVTSTVMASDVWYGSLRQWWCWMYGMGHFDSDGVRCMVWVTSTVMASDVWYGSLRQWERKPSAATVWTIFPLAAKVLLYTPSYRQDGTYHSLCYTSRGALAGMRYVYWLQGVFYPNLFPKQIVKMSFAFDGFLWDIFNIHFWIS